MEFVCIYGHINFTISKIIFVFLLPYCDISVSESCEVLMTYFQIKTSLVKIKKRKGTFHFSFDYTKMFAA